MDKTRVAVIGCGAIAQRRHLPEYKLRSDVEVVAVVDVNEKRAKEVAQKFGVPNYFTDYRKALKMQVDAASICTPTAFHAPYSIAFLKAKAHVLCEKPMAATMAEARAMNAAAKASRRQLMIGHNQRLHGAHVRGKQIYQSGILGKCLSFETTFGHGGPEGWSVDGLKCHFFKKEQAVWGSMADLGVHKLDLVRWLLGEDYVQASAMYGTLSKKNCTVEDSAFAVLQTDRGTLGKLVASWCFTSGNNSTILYCEKGVLRLEADPEFNVVAILSNGERQCYKTKALQTNEAGGQTTSGVVNEFVQAIRSGRPVAIPGQDVIKSLAAVVACIESGKTRRQVKVAKA